ncbi:hypothetical protein FB561_2427 [Kribbella amoyensis]|uniref:Uncharacterized protein n=1 Tax=Kribbella amoyensis TaxID=996641 RepID=A0A561BR25_9ACTN|nr:hypothetical protein [Kribbella amoyensis]TWD81315.1 hypothetical protein FB561_2427 [Kribbella amoyensis]
MTTTVHTATLFPIGHYTGRRIGEDGNPAHTIRIGWRHHRLDEDAFGTWVLAHGVPDRGKAAWTEDDVLREAGEAGIPAADHLRTLSAAGLVASVADDAEEFARAHRMGVLFVGLGNSPEMPDQFAIGLPGLGTVAGVDPDSYELWQWGSVTPTLWHSCELRASVTSRHEQTVSAREALIDVLGDLRLLIASGCAYLDMATTE